MKRFSVLMLLLLLSTAALAQKADAAFVFGGAFASDTNAVFTPALVGGNTPLTIKTGNSIFLEGAVSFRVLGAKPASLHLELPFVGVLSQKTTTEIPILRGHISAIFITPAARLKLLPDSAVSPWLSVGGGLAHYYTGDCCQSKGALQFGGGLDFKTRLPRLGFRAEVRDFVTENPGFNLFFRVSSLNSGLDHHNILVGGGIVLRLGPAER
jgi:hypothetical protein